MLTGIEDSYEDRDVIERQRSFYKRVIEGRTDGHEDVDIRVHT